MNTKEPDPLEEAIARVMLAMTHVDTDTEEFTNLLTHLERLSALKPERRKPLSLDAVAQVGGTILAILIVVGYEHHHVITSKALSFVRMR